MTRSTCHLLSLAGLAAVAAIAHAMALPASAVSGPARVIIFWTKCRAADFSRRSTAPSPACPMQLARLHS